MEKLTELRKLHDEIKEHPYWLNFDKALLPDICNKFHKLSMSIPHNDFNPYCVILARICHGFNCMLSNIQFWLKDQRYEERKGDIIAVLQTYLMNVHRLVENSELDNPTAFICEGKKLLKFEVVKDKYKMYHAVLLITADDLKMKILGFTNLKDENDSTKKWAIKCMKELEEGNEIIDNRYKIIS